MDKNNSIYKGVSRNAICPCGSGERFKNCHGNISKNNKNQKTIHQVNCLMIYFAVFRENIIN